MATAASLVLPVVSSVARKAAAELVQTVTRMWGIDADRDRLERRLLAVQCLLADAEAKSETNPVVRRWMQDLNAAAYRADDVLDCFEYEARRRQVAKDAQRSITDKVTSHFTRDNSLLFRRKMSWELKNVLRKIDELVEEMNKFGLVERAAEPQVPYRQTYSSLDESEEKIYGRGDDKAVVVKLLLDQQNQQNVQVLPVIGMGGLGKTTLAKMVYNDSRVQNHFELKLWHCVSDNFEAPSLVRSIIELATKGRCDLPDNIELLRGKLVDVIGRKRFLLILDDVWNEEEHKWEDHLMPLLCSSIGGSGSMIVVTSRSQNVASLMGTLPPHKPAYLNKEDSWKLFSKKAFSKGVQETEELVTVGRRIVDKCKGLPLALKAMGGLMSAKEAVSEWMAVADTNIGDTSKGKDSVMSILKLSYKCLSPEMKRCFAFCAIYPKDDEMEKDELIQLWMANHFIHAEGMVDLAQKGEFIFNELVWRSFLQDVNECTGFYGDHLTIFFQMHDLMHDLAKDATEECAFAEELIQEKASIKCVRHIGISDDELIQTKTLLKGASCLRTLLTHSEYKDLKDLRLKSLKALRCTEPSHSLVKYPRYLQFLDLSGSKTIRLSDSICMLYNLQSLRLNGCSELQYLPEGLATSLRKLQHIYLDGCHALKEMPPKLSLLQNLSRLTMFIVGTKDGCGIEELKDLKHLSNMLELKKLRAVKSGSKANLHEKHNLCELILNWNDPKESNSFADDDINHAEEILESLVPPSQLKRLVVHGYLGREISQWMRDPQMFRCLKTLTMSQCGLCKDMPLVWLSSSLEKLYLEHMYNLTTLCKSLDVEAARYTNFPQVFPRLKNMYLDVLPNLERWTEEPRSLLMFPRLKNLKVSGCPKLTTLPEGPLLTLCVCVHEAVSVPVSMPLGAWPSLVNLEIGGLANVDVYLEEKQAQSSNRNQSLRILSISGDDAFTSIFNISKLQRGLADCLVHVEVLEISGLSNTVRWPVEELRYLPDLRYLNFRCCQARGKERLSYEKFLPLLETIFISYCENLLEIPELPPSIRILDIRGCRGLMALPSNLGNLAKLRELGVSSCSALKTLPHGMDGLTSLERLSIRYCPEIVEFPQGLLQRLPTLQSLEILGCPDLQRRCREGGEYFGLVCAIPKTDIGSAINPETEAVERPVKRFPFCGGDSRLSCIRF